MYGEYLTLYDLYKLLFGFYRGYFYTVPVLMALMAFNLVKTYYLCFGENVF